MRAFAAAAALLASACSGTASTDATQGPVQAGVIVERDGSGVVARQGDGSCSWSLEQRVAEPALLHYRNPCIQPHDDKIKHLDELMLAMFADGRLPESVRGLYIGVLGETFPALRLRLLMSASYRPPEEMWQARNAGRESRYVSSLIEEEDNLAELEALFLKWGMRITATHVEKVQTGHGPALAERGWLPRDKVAERQLPYDAMTWFRLQPSMSTTAASH